MDAELVSEVSALGLKVTEPAPIVCARGQIGQVFDELLDRVQFIYTRREANLNLILRGCSCARDVYTFFLSLAADQVMQIDLYDFAKKLWAAYEEYAPQPRMSIAPGLSVVCVGYYPVLSRARYTLQPPGRDGLVLLLSASIGVLPKYSWLPKWARKRVKVVGRPGYNYITALSPPDGCPGPAVALCGVWRVAGPPGMWDTTTERYARWTTCLEKISALCAEKKIKSVHLPRQIGASAHASVWHKYEESFHRWANMNPQIECVVHL